MNLLVLICLSVSVFAGHGDGLERGLERSEDKGTCEVSCNETGQVTNRNSAHCGEHRFCPYPLEKQCMEVKHDFHTECVSESWFLRTPLSIQSFCKAFREYYVSFEGLYHFEPSSYQKYEDACLKKTFGKSYDPYALNFCDGFHIEIVATHRHLVFKCLDIIEGKKFDLGELERCEKPASFAISDTGKKLRCLKDVAKKSPALKR